MSLYADVSETLPADIVEAIEVSLPCPISREHHFWEFESIEIMSLRGPVRQDRYWHCAYCRLITFTNPHP